jgi:iron complex outermembrane recepter protein
MGAVRVLGWCLVVGVVLCLLGPGMGFAEDSQSEMMQLEEVVVTATRTEKVLEDAPASVSVITQEDLAKQNVKTLDEALRVTPGLYAKRTKGMMDSTSSIAIRGFRGDQYTLVLIDGLPVNDAYTGGLEWGTLPITNIERIEVVRGPASALYGGNAMGGVINVITKTRRNWR